MLSRLRCFTSSDSVRCNSLRFLGITPVLGLFPPVPEADAAPGMDVLGEAVGTDIGVLGDPVLWSD